MSSKHVLAAVFLAMLLVGGGGPRRVEAQAYVSTTAHRVPFERLDTLRQLIKESKPVLAEARRQGAILDDVWLIHAWGGEYNVVEMTTWKSWAAIEDTTVGFGPAFRKVQPDSLARKKINDRWGWVFSGVSHVDNIYTKVE